ELPDTSVRFTLRTRRRNGNHEVSLSAHRTPPARLIPRTSCQHLRGIQILLHLLEVRSIQTPHAPGISWSKFFIFRSEMRLFAKAPMMICYTNNDWRLSRDLCRQ